MGGVGGTIYFNLPFNFKREGPLYFIRLKKNNHNPSNFIKSYLPTPPPPFITMYPKSLINWTTCVLGNIYMKRTSTTLQQVINYSMATSYNGTGRGKGKVYCILIIQSDR